VKQLLPDKRDYPKYVTLTQSAIHSGEIDLYDIYGRFYSCDGAPENKMDPRDRHVHGEDKRFQMRSRVSNRAPRDQKSYRIKIDHALRDQ